MDLHANQADISVVLNEDIIAHIMQFSPEVQASLAVCNSRLKKISDRYRPFQTFLAETLSIPKLVDLPLMYDLYGLVGLQFKPEEKFHAACLLYRRSFGIFEQSSIVDRLKRIALQVLKNASFEQIVQDFPYFGWEAKLEALQFFMECGRLDVLHLLHCPTKWQEHVVDKKIAHNLARLKPELFAEALATSERESDNTFDLANAVESNICSYLLYTDCNPELLKLVLAGKTVINILSMLVRNIPKIEAEASAFRAVLSYGHELLTEQERSSFEDVERLVEIRFNPEFNFEGGHVVNRNEFIVANSAKRFDICAQFDNIHFCHTCTHYNSFYEYLDEHQPHLLPKPNFREIFNLSCCRVIYGAKSIADLVSILVVPKIDKEMLETLTEQLIKGKYLSELLLIPVHFSLLPYISKILTCKAEPEDIISLLNGERFDLKRQYIELSTDAFAFVVKYAERFKILSKRVILKTLTEQAVLNDDFFHHLMRNRDHLPIWKNSKDLIFIYNSPRAIKRVILATGCTFETVYGRLIKELGNTHWLSIMPVLLVWNYDDRRGLLKFLEKNAKFSAQEIESRHISMKYSSSFMKKISIMAMRLNP